MADSDIQGTVTDSSDNPVNGAVVYLLPEGVGQNNAIKTTTDSNGDYIFDGHPDGDGTSKQWHVAAYYEDQNSNLFNAFSKPNVSASLPKQSVIPDSGLLRYTYEDDGDTTTVTDVWNSNDGTINGDPTYTTTGANEGNALDLDGSGDYVDTGVSADVANSWSVATYIHADALGGSDEFFVGATQFGVLGVFNSASDVGVFVQDDSGSNQSAQEPVSNLSDNTLYHLVGVYDDSVPELRYYRDGSKIATTDVSGSSFSTSNNWVVGIRGDLTREFDGRVDQTDVYTKALSDSEVSDLYSNGSI